VEPEITALHRFLHWSIEHAEWVISSFFIGIGVIALGAWKFLHTRFPTKDEQEACRLRMENQTTERITAFDKTNREAHKKLEEHQRHGFEDVKRDIGRIMDHLLGKDG